MDIADNSQTEVQNRPDYRPEEIKISEDPGQIYTGVDIVHNIFFLSLLGLSQDYIQLQSDLAPAYNFFKMAQCEYNI